MKKRKDLEPTSEMPEGEGLQPRKKSRARRVGGVLGTIIGALGAVFYVILALAGIALLGFLIWLGYRIWMLFKTGM